MRRQQWLQPTSSRNQPRFKRAEDLIDKGVMTQFGNDRSIVINPKDLDKTVAMLNSELARDDDKLRTASATSRITDRHEPDQSNRWQVTGKYRLPSV